MRYKASQLLQRIDAAIVNYGSAQISGRFPNDIVELLEDCKDFVSLKGLEIKYETIDKDADSSYNVMTDRDSKGEANIT